MNFAEAISLAREVGYKESCQFAQRKAHVREILKFTGKLMSDERASRRRTNFFVG